MRFAVGPEPRWRLSLHLFRDRKPRTPSLGAHVKLRQQDTYKHAIVKLRYGAAFGQAGARKELWIAWFESRKGVRGLVNGWRLRFSVDRMRSFKPAKNTHIAVYPNRTRSREDPFEIL